MGNGSQKNKEKEISVMLEVNKDLEQNFENAVQLASLNNHEYITLEHFL